MHVGTKQTLNRCKGVEAVRFHTCPEAQLSTSLKRYLAIHREEVILTNSTEYYTREHGGVFT